MGKDIYLNGLYNNNSILNTNTAHNRREGIILFNCNNNNRVINTTVLYSRGGGMSLYHTYNNLIVNITIHHWKECSLPK